MTQTTTPLFPKNDRSQWENVLLKELKGEPISTLIKTDPVEEFSFPAALHTDAVSHEWSNPGAFPFTRGWQNASNGWINSATIQIDNSSSEAALNENILHWLMNGATGLYLVDKSSTSFNWSKVFDQVGFDFIHVTVLSANSELVSFIEEHSNGKCTILAGATNQFVANGFAVQQAGGTTWQEVAIALAEAHDFLVSQLDNGKQPQEVLSNIQFNLGIGANYLFEIAKIRTLRTLWSTISKHYSDEVVPPFVTATSGFVHLSLQDPTTNLLRQTTQAMSAVVGGVDQLIVQPYDLYAEQQDLAFTTRMAVNIGCLLADESYLDKVLDAAGGSYVLETISEAMLERAWAEFKRIEREGGLSSMLNVLKEEIEQKRALRVDLLKSGKMKLIGINVFPNPSKETNAWKNVPIAWQQLSTFIYEEQL